MAEELEVGVSLWDFSNYFGNTTPTPSSMDGCRTMHGRRIRGHDMQFYYSSCAGNIIIIIITGGMHGSWPIM